MWLLRKTDLFHGNEVPGLAEIETDGSPCWSTPRWPFHNWGLLRHRVTMAFSLWNRMMTAETLLTNRCFSQVELFLMKWLLRNQTIIITFLYLVYKETQFEKLLILRILIRWNWTCSLFLALQFSNQMVKFVAKFHPDASVQMLFVTRTDKENDSSESHPALLLTVLL